MNGMKNRNMSENIICKIMGPMEPCLKRTDKIGGESDVDVQFTFAPSNLEEQIVTQKFPRLETNCKFDFDVDK